MKKSQNIYNLDLNPWGVHQRIIKSISSTSRVLEVGCASGHLLEQLQAKGAKVWGIEINKIAAIRGKRKKIPILLGDIEDAKVFKNLKNRHFDFIIAADVLEHTRDPKKVIQFLLPFLAKNGTMIISVPNIAFITNRITHLFGKFAYTQYGIMDRTHLRFFTRESIEALVKDCGLKIQKIESVGNFTQLPLYMRIFLPLIRKWWLQEKIEQLVTRIWSRGLAVQFLIFATNEL